MKKNNTRNVKIFFLYLILVFSSVLTNAQTYTLKNAPIGGGGFVTGIVTHPVSGDRYCRTDVGGAYRWDAANNKWIQLLDWTNESENGFYGVDALAIDPQNANNVYMLCGLEYSNSGRTAILKSTDKGNTFTYTDVTAKFKTHGNGNGRGNGERLAVDPKNSNILFCGTRYNGLWKSTDAGVTWNLAWNGVTTTTSGNGICFVQFDPSGSVVNGVSQTIYIGVSRTGAGNIYKSTDGGATFTDISPNTGFMPHRVSLQGTTMYATLAVEAGPWIGDYSPAYDMGRVYKLNTSTGIWTNVTPADHPTAKYPYGGVSIDPSNINRVIISTCGMYWNNQYGVGWGDFVFLSTDGGSTWTLKNGPNATYNNNGMAWTNGVVNWMDCVEFDPANPSIVRAVGGGGVYTCSDITATNPSWKYDVKGIEETGMTDAISIPGGPFISTFGDITGFVHNDLTSPPASTYQPADGSNWSIAYATANTNKIVRVGSNNIYYSNDKGATWTATATNKGDVALSKVAISADGGTILNIPHGSTTTYYTTNNGGSWSRCMGVSDSYMIPVADPVNSNYFYIYNPYTGQMLRSSNKGANFSVAGTPGTNSFETWVRTTLIRTVPGLEGHLWVPLGGNGLKYSTDHGATYTTLANVSYCTSVAIGKAIAGANYPTLFIWGTVSGVTGLYRSTDKGATWGTRINDDAHEFGGMSLIGDMNVDGRVYMSAGATRGLHYWDASTVGTNYTLTTSINGSGTISMNPSGGVYAAGTVVTVTANPASGWQFSGWSGNLSGSTNPTTLTMNGNKSITATFTSIGVGSTMHVQNIITYTQAANQSSKRGVAEVTILDNLGNPVSAATVTGTFSGSFNETRTAQTNSNGVAVLTTSASAKGKVTVNICVNNVTHGSLTYNSTENVITCTGGSAARLASGNESKFQVQLSPNPFTSSLNLKISRPEEVTNITIFDVSGRRLQTIEHSAVSNTMSVGASLKPGVYLVKVNSINGSQSFKVVKE